MPGLTSQSGGAASVSGMRQRLLRRLRRLGHFWMRILTLTQRLLLGSTVVVVVAMGVLGFWASEYLKDGITEGVAATAAASIDSLAAWHLRNLVVGQPLSAEERARIGEIFEISNDANSTRLLQIRIHDVNGAVFYDSADGLMDTEDTSDQLAAAAAGQTVANIRELTLAPVGPIEGHRIDVLKIYSPLHRPETGEIFAVAELYYSAKSVLDLQARTQRDVWLLVGLIGIGALAALYLIIDQVSRTISLQRTHLAQNLAASRQLAEENRALHAASERLRVSANSANESLLAQVGTDIHDGPLQLLTLAILRLTQQKVAAKENAREAANLHGTIQLTTDAMDELRTISTGLVLPELAPLNLEETLLLAIERHEQATGTVVARELRDLPLAGSIAVKICAYRIVQEALNNAYRHGGAVEQRVRAAIGDGTIDIEVTNGVGRTDDAGPAQVESADASPAGADKLGLRGMRFRVESLGGTLDVDVANTARARVAARIPLEVVAG
jgi:signal transduction histidine kinase